MKKLLIIASLAIAVVTLQGCATSATVQGMTAQNTIKSTNLREQVAVAPVSGGKSTNPLWVSQVASADFEAALIASLKSADLLSPQSNAPLVLKAELISLAQPMFGLDMTVTARVHYTVTNTQGKIVFDEFLETPHTTKMGEAFIGTKRLQIANEGSIRDNIESLIRKLEAIGVQKLSLQ